MNPVSTIKAYSQCYGLNEDNPATDPHVVPAETDIVATGSSKYNSHFTDLRIVFFCIILVTNAQIVCFLKKIITKTVNDN